LAIDAARLGLVVVDLARLLGEALADIVGILGDVPAQFAHRLAQRLLARGGRRGQPHPVAAALALLLRRTAERRRHQRLLDPGRAAHRTFRAVLVEIGAGAEPGFELMVALAAKLETDHRRAAASAPGLAGPSKLRSLASAGTLSRAE